MSCLLLNAINGHLQDSVPRGRIIGECPALIEARHAGDVVQVRLVLDIWNPDFQDTQQVEAWLTSLGAECVEISQTLLDRANLIADGVCEDGTRTWVVDADFPSSAPILADLDFEAPHHDPDDVARLLQSARSAHRTMLRFGNQIEAYDALASALNQFPGEQ